METALALTKERLGIRSAVRDTYITAVVEGVITDLTDVHGLAIDLANPSHLMFVVDFSTWRYLNRDSMEGMPRHLQFRLHNLLISKVKDGASP